MLQYHSSVEEDVEFKIIDSSGDIVETGWYLPQAKNIHKSVFFNLEPGIYQVVVKSKAGVWLDSSTIALDYWTNSIVNLGSQIKVKSQLD